MIKNYGIEYTKSYNKFVVDSIEKDSIVLDVGCSSGGNGIFLIKNKNCIVDGIDFDESSLSIAKESGYNNVYCINLNEKYDLGFITDKKYDFIILADVLEHLIYPEDLLVSLKNKLKDDGIIIISIPNIAFILYRIKLLFGFFDYNINGGIMDINHLRFFTKKTIKNLCVDSGFKVLNINGYNIVKKKFFILKYLGNLFPSVFCLQYLIEIKK